MRKRSHAYVNDYHLNFAAIISESVEVHKTEDFWNSIHTCNATVVQRVNIGLLLYQQPSTSLYFTSHKLLATLYF